VRLHLPMEARLVECHPYSLENTGRVALLRGPLLYCVEATDNPGLDVRDLVLPASASFSAEFQPQVLGGAVLLRGPAQVAPPEKDWEGRLYRTARPRPVQPAGRAGRLTAIPYYAWGNREPGPMRVWLRAQPR
jgi:DUF1680 family protein